MRRIVVLIAVSACLALAQAQDSKLVSSAFGGRITLLEREIAGALIFTITTTMPSPVKQYVIETWGTSTQGTLHRFCSITSDQAETRCNLTADPARGQPVSHSSKIVSVELANGWKWQHSPAIYRVPR